MDDQIVCPCCGFSSDEEDDFDVLGACEGSLFCPACHCEFDPNTGRRTPLCGSGDCSGCQQFRKDGSFNKVQAIRRQLIEQDEHNGN